MKIKRYISLLIVLALLTALTLPAAFADEGDGRVLHIAKPEDLAALAVSCAEDDYSLELTVILDNDIDLSGVDYYPIPSFSGIFDGAGHSVLNMDTVTNGSHQGFFRYVQKEGVVKNLRVEGSVIPEGSRNQLGGIAGVNSGRIENCSFEGFVKGLNNVGGIAGENRGDIIDCSAEGTVEGKRSAGGIAGVNSGLISGCSNSARVNTSISQEKMNLEELSLADITNLDLKNANDEDTVSDSGGIAGYSTGSIENSVNTGTIGYKHYGYNVGGIAGRQSGFIYDCENSGVILGRKDVGGIVGQMEPFMILTDTVNLSDEINTLNGLVAGTVGDVGSASDGIASALENANPGPGWSDFIPGYGDGGISSAPQGGISGDSWLPNLGGYNDTASSLMNSLGNSTDAMAQGLVGISGQVARIATITAGLLSEEDRAIIIDISEEIPEDDTDGRVKSCVNTGLVDADKNVGGVAGEMGIEYEFDLEGSISEFLGVGGIFSATYQTKCINDSNVNKGSVNGKKDNIGGIVGLEKLGTVIDCEGYGSVKSEDGGCVGGVAGRSESSVRGSYAMCNLSGGANVGGIAGYGTIISGCGSLVGIEDLTAPCCGAIAGWAKIDNPDIISNNLYVHETIGAVDGISYAGQAEKMSYDDFLQMEGLPEQFRRLKLSFTAEGKNVGEIEFTYGGSVDESLIPSVPEKEGYSGHWPEYDYSALYFSDTIEAVYTPRQAAIASRELRADTPMSIVLMEGDFGDSAFLNLNQYDGEGPVISSGEITEKWIVKIADPDEDKLGSYTVRFAPPITENNVNIHIFDGEKWTKANTGVNGSYMTFEGSGDTVIFAVQESEKNNTALIIIIASILIILLLAAVLIIRKKSKKKKTEAEPAEEKIENDTSDIITEVPEKTSENKEE